MKKHLSTILLVLILLVGVAIMLYPTVSDYVNSLHQSRAVATYAQKVENMDSGQYEEILKAARQYNAELAQNPRIAKLTDAEAERYAQLLNVDGNGVMGYIEIPSIRVSLPIYHGTSDVVLQSGVGHTEWSSLPVGGEGSHCVLPGHRGLPSAKLFTNLDKLVEGDTFTLHVLNEVLTYEVDQILVVEPQETEALQIVPGKDYCTLVTCTPYGINSHRLLVRGHRVANAGIGEAQETQSTQDAAVVADAPRVEPVIVVLLVICGLVILVSIVLLLKEMKRRHK